MSTHTSDTLDYKDYVGSIEFDENDKVNREDIGIVLTENGTDKCVLFPFRRCAPEDEWVTVEIEQDLYEQVTELIEPMHTSHEELISAFLKWCVDPATQHEAMAWLKGASAQ